MTTPANGALSLPGATLRFQVAGSGPAVVLVHGFGLDMRMWTPQYAELGREFTVVRYDCRGFGSSGPFDPAIPYTHAGDLIALLDHLSIEHATITGLSFGGRVAVQTALAAPSRVQALVLLDSVLDGVPWDAESEAGLAELSRQVAAGGVAAGRTAWLAHPLFAAARRDPVLAEQLAAMVADYPGQHWLGIDPHLPDDLPLIQALEQITAPALVVAGQHDVPGFLAMSEVLARRLPAAEHVLIPDAGHMVSMEQPGLVNAAIGGFLRRQAPRQNAEIT
jgi:3-oxoadipate enol-lactonase